FLQARREVNPRRIGLIGHSEGGLIAPLVAAQSPDVSMIVLLAGPGVPGEQILVEQGRLIWNAMGMSAPEIERRQKIQAGVFEITKAKLDSATTEARVRALYRGLGAPADSAGLEAEIRSSVRTARSPWLRYFLVHDPRPTLKRVMCPVLAMNGSKDVQVPPKQN